MANAYELLLDATLQHMETLKRQGARYISVSQENLAALYQEPHHNQDSAGRTLAKPALKNDTFASAKTGSGFEKQEEDQSKIGPEIDDAQSGSRGLKIGEVAMSDLRERALVCQKCPHLARSRKNVVFGVGDIAASLMFIGEAPGADEDEQGEPFVGKAGQLLTRVIQTMGLSRQTVYIANILKCRPDTPGQTSGNRKPTSDEMKTCLPYLLAQIDIIQPAVIVALGATAVDGLLGKTVGISKLRGHFKEFRGVPVMPTYHPSYLLRNQSLKVKREVWEDMLKVLERLKMPISEKQRNYFLKG